jgi:hypothetical protein
MHLFRGSSRRSQVDPGNSPQGCASALIVRVMVQAANALTHVFDTTPTTPGCRAVAVASRPAVSWWAHSSPLHQADARTPLSFRL